MGDGRLSSLCKTIISQLFGMQNRTVLKQICDDWLSNENWVALALAYRLDQYIGWPVPVSEAIKASEDQPYNTIFDCREGQVRTLNKQSRNRYRLCKSWAAYWMCILSDRERWNESIEDVKAVLRRLLLLKYGEPAHLAAYNLRETTLTGTYTLNSTVSSSTDASTTKINEDKLLSPTKPPAKGSDGVGLFGTAVSYPNYDEKEPPQKCNTQELRLGPVAAYARDSLLYHNHMGTERILFQPPSDINE